MNEKLEVRGLEAWYGESHVLHGIDFDVPRGKVVTLLGRNGAGKTTTMRAITGLVRKRTGAIRLDGRDLLPLPPHHIARAGIGYCPEERGIFSTLCVHENLMLPPTLAAGGLSVEQIYELFPNLKERHRSQGTKLSGGEQQMLAIARILRTGAKLLLLDEPSEGLAPVIVKQIRNMIRAINAQGFTILLVEQNLRFAESIADEHVIIDQGKVIDRMTRADVAANRGRLREYLGV